MMNFQRSISVPEPVATIASSKDFLHSQILQISLIGVQCSVFIPRTHHSDPEPNWYIYHSDHLGSSSFLTDASGTPTQHLQYMPFGENFIEQRSVTSYYTPYTFSAKERDTETGYSYFGARYYDADISIWLSVDPMADKYPSMSAYMYCAGNPVILVDPDGTWIPGLDENGQVILTKEKGDNLQTLQKFFKGSDFSKKQIENLYKTLSDKGELNLTKELGGIFAEITKSFKSNLAGEHNCYSTSIDLATTGKINLSGDLFGPDAPSKVDKLLKKLFKIVTKDDLILGKTILRYSTEGRATPTHLALFIGRDSNGNDYVVAKMGEFRIDIQRADLPHVKADQTITKKRLDLRKTYGKITGYYNPK